MSFDTIISRICNTNNISYTHDGKEVHIYDGTTKLAVKENDANACSTTDDVARHTFGAMTSVNYHTLIAILKDESKAHLGAKQRALFTALDELLEDVSTAYLCPALTNSRSTMLGKQRNALYLDIFGAIKIDGVVRPVDITFTFTGGEATDYLLKLGCTFDYISRIISNFPSLCHNRAWSALDNTILTIFTSHLTIDNVEGSDVQMSADDDLQSVTIHTKEGTLRLDRSLTDAHIAKLGISDTRTGTDPVLLSLIDHLEAIEVSDSTLNFTFYLRVDGLTSKLVAFNSDDHHYQLTWIPKGEPSNVQSISSANNVG